MRLEGRSGAAVMLFLALLGYLRRLGVENQRAVYVGAATVCATACAEGLLPARQKD
jgi:hypothetical protein